MNKQEYLESIRSRISAMPADDVNRFMDYYSEMIDDRVEDGLSEDGGLWRIWDLRRLLWSRYLRRCRSRSL